ncbi:unnamed protein product [Lathyrus sativus]|nr:unnamed protein product [Lathyrus sativus]
MSDLQLNLCTHFGIYRCESSLWGLGKLNARVPRLPVSQPCPTSQDQVFRDQYHPTEAASQIFADRVLDGLSTYTYSINTRQLLQTKLQALEGFNEGRSWQKFWKNIPAGGLSVDAYLKVTLPNFYAHEYSTSYLSTVFMILCSL